MGGPAVRDHDALTLHRVLVAKPRSPDIEAAGMDEQAFVEAGGLQVADVGLEHDRLEPEVAQALVAARIEVQVIDPGHLEPDEVARVVRDPLRVGLGEPHLHLG
jgi:hypothetical protein